MNIDIYNRFIELEERVKELERYRPLRCPEIPVTQCDPGFIQIEKEPKYPHWNQIYYGYRTGI